MESQVQEPKAFAMVDVPFILIEDRSFTKVFSIEELKSIFGNHLDKFLLEVIPLLIKDKKETKLNLKSYSNNETRDLTKQEAIESVLRVDWNKKIPTLVQFEDQSTTYRKAQLAIRLAGPQFIAYGNTWVITGTMIEEVREQGNKGFLGSMRDAISGKKQVITGKIYRLGIMSKDIFATTFAQPFPNLKEYNFDPHEAIQLWETFARYGIILSFKEANNSYEMVRLIFGKTVKFQMDQYAKTIDELLNEEFQSSTTSEISFSSSFSEIIDDVVKKYLPENKKK